MCLIEKKYTLYERKKYGKITNICVTRISNPGNGAKITFETYN